jgi:hypothetical protein
VKENDSGLRVHCRFSLWEPLSTPHTSPAIVVLTPLSSQQPMLTWEQHSTGPPGYSSGEQSPSPQPPWASHTTHKTALLETAEQNSTHGKLRPEPSGPSAAHFQEDPEYGHILQDRGCGTLPRERPRTSDQPCPHAYDLTSYADLSGAKLTPEARLWLSAT